MKITKHAYRRAKERLGLNKKAFERLFEKIQKQPTMQKKAKGRLKKYLDSIFFKYGANKIRLYGDYMYIFKGGDLVTLYPIPHYHKKSAFRNIE
jgi:hypothetical protein